MGWVWLDDLMPEHPKVLAVGPVAAWLHVCAIAYSNRSKTDGFIPEAKLTSLGNVARPKQEAGKLVGAGLWHTVSGGYEIHDYSDYQLTRADRAERSKAGKKGARKRWGSSGNGAVAAAIAEAKA